MTCNTSAVAVCCSSASRVSVMQPRVLHRDDRLRREVLQQRDLLVGERPDLLAVGDNGAEQRIVLAQRHEEIGAYAAKLDMPRQRDRRYAASSHIGDVNEAFAVA